MKKLILYNSAILRELPDEVQKVIRGFTPSVLFKNRLFKTALGETPFYRIFKDFKVIVRIPEKKSYVEYIDAYQVDDKSGEKIPLDPATQAKIDESLKKSKQHSLIPTSAIQRVLQVAFGASKSSTNTSNILSSIGIEEDITLAFPLMEFMVSDQLRKFNKFTVKAKTRLRTITHIIAFLEGTSHFKTPFLLTNTNFAIT